MVAISAMEAITIAALNKMVCVEAEELYLSALADSIALRACKRIFVYCSTWGSYCSKNNLFALRSDCKVFCVA